MLRQFKAIVALCIALFLISSRVPEIDAQVTTPVCDLQLIFVVDTAFIGGNDSIYKTITDNIDAMLRYISEYYTYMIPESNISYSLIVTNSNSTRIAQLLGPVAFPPLYWINLHEPPGGYNLDTMLPSVYFNARDIVDRSLNGTTQLSSLENVLVALQSLSNKEKSTQSRRALFYIGGGSVQENVSNPSMRDMLWSQSGITDAYFLGTANDGGSVKPAWTDMTQDNTHVFIPDIHPGPMAVRAYKDDMITERFLFMHWLHAFEQLIDDACSQSMITRHAQYPVPNPLGAQQWNIDVADGQAVLRIATAYDPTLTTNTLNLFAPDNTPVAQNQLVRRFDQDRQIIIWEIINPPPGEWRVERSATDFYNNQQTSVFGWQFLHIRSIPYNSEGYVKAELQVGNGQVFQQASNQVPTIFRHQSMTIRLSFPDGDPRINPLSIGQMSDLNIQVELCNLSCSTVTGVQVQFVPTQDRSTIFNISFPVTIQPSHLSSINVKVSVNTASAPPINQRPIGIFAVKRYPATDTLLEVADVAFKLDCQRSGSGLGIQGMVQIAASDPALTPYITQVNWLDEVIARATLFNHGGGQLTEPLEPDSAGPGPNAQNYRLVWNMENINTIDNFRLHVELRYPDSNADPFQYLRCDS